MSEEDLLGGNDEPAPGGAPADTGERELSRERMDTVLVVFTLLGVCLYLPLTWWLLRARSIAASAVFWSGPVACALFSVGGAVFWCMRRGVTRRFRFFWAVALTLALLGWPQSCVSVIVSGASPMDWH
jgi:hypothetical protein